MSGSGAGNSDGAALGGDNLTFHALVYSHRTGPSSSKNISLKSEIDIL